MLGFHVRCAPPWRLATHTKDAVHMKSDTCDNNSIELTVHHNEPETRFQKLWNEAERLKRQNVELEAALDELVLRIKSSIGPVEMDMGRAMRVQIDKLILFGARQSLPPWQMHVLDDWIMSSMDFLQSIGLVDDALTDAMATLQAQTLGFEIDASCDIPASEQLADYMESQVKDMGAEFYTDDGLDEFDEAQDVLNWYEEKISQSDHEDIEDAQTRRESVPADTAIAVDEIDQTQPQSVFKTLFHRVARALHPDKENDPKQRKVKQALMAELLEARRQRDLIRVFQLYQEHVDDHTDFEMQELAELEKVLCQFIELESQRQLEITTKSHLHDIAYTQFYSDDPNEISRAIAKKIEEVEQRKGEIEAFSKNVTSFKKLGPYLDDRYKQLRQYL